MTIGAMNALIPACQTRADVTEKRAVLLLRGVAG
jgi:hypothetical protein